MSRRRRRRADAARRGPPPRPSWWCPRRSRPPCGCPCRRRRRPPRRSSRGRAAGGAGSAAAPMIPRVRHGAEAYERNLTGRHISSYRRAVRLGDIANAAAAGARQAPRRRPHPRPRADAGPPLRHPAAGPPRRRRGEGRAPEGRRPRAAARCPAMTDPEGRSVGATFLRNNLNKRSICIDLKTDRGPPARARPGAPLRRGRRELQGRRHGPPRPRLRRHRRRPPGRSSTCRCRASGTPIASPYDAWPAFAPIVEAMSGIYEFKRHGRRPAARRPGRRARRHRLRRCSPSSACSPRCATATPPAWASTSTSPCSTPWWP